MKQQVKIEKKVPLPMSAYMDFPFGSMKVGESFTAIGIYVRSAASQWKRRHPGWNYTTRQIGDGQVRLWRTA